MQLLTRLFCQGVEQKFSAVFLLQDLTGSVSIFTKPRIPGNNLLYRGQRFFGFSTVDYYSCIKPLHHPRNPCSCSGYNGTPGRKGVQCYTADSIEK